MIETGDGARVNAPAPPRAPGRVRPAAARLGYAALFVVLLPALLVAWAHRLDQWVTLPVVDFRTAGYALVVVGLVVMASGTAALWRHGRGLPMSAFPPERLVTRGIYAYVADPLYIGAVAVSVGLSLAARSPAGLWIVSPVLTLSCVAWVTGFERDATRRRFGAVAEPVLSLPRARDDPPTAASRLAVYLLALVPWLVLYLAVERLGVPPAAWELDLALDRAIPVMAWTEAIYFAVYPMVVLAPLAARRERDLRRFAVRGLVATAFIIPIYLLLPVVYEARPVGPTGFWEGIMRWERTGDAPVTALPAFHVVWACIAAELYTGTWKRGWVVWGVVALVAASCVTTGMHSVVDVVAGGAAWVIVRHAGTIWGAVRRASEATANSWAEWHLGPLRLMSHGVFAGLGVAAGALVVLSLAGATLAWWVAGATVAAGVAAALWAQAVEGSPLLLRPFGYFGGVFGVLAVVLVAGLSGADAWRLLAAYLSGLAFGQGIARVRCLINGCCHGRPADPAIGIRYMHPRTRVARLAGLAGVPIHPTQVYALGFTLVVGFVLVRLWVAGAPLSFVAGTYFILIGLGRFVEEHFRGEPQTATLAGLRLYQWLAVAFIVGGAALTAVRTVSAPAPTSLDWRSLGLSLGLAVAAFAAFGADLPGSSRRFARTA